ncbi:hypothetical protein MED134_06909 [Dokdonia sp. MED134]|uniref:hypothetical protein n=1 Tax=Dokdonia sp. MED134 TaxID=313590 RepID=UPI000068AA43|nr:hypothetical protein [Dokdonia sp. MED134]EAQ40465.1 hypothetical protein MED134_06909 [Dokdonia sp. MED134]
MTYFILDQLFGLTLTIVISLFFTKLTLVWFEQRRVKDKMLLKYQIIIFAGCLTASYVLKNDIIESASNSIWNFDIPKITIYLLFTAILITLTRKNFEKGGQKMFATPNSSPIYFFKIQNIIIAHFFKSENGHTQSNQEQFKEHSSHTYGSTKVKLDNFKNEPQLKLLTTLKNKPSQSEKTKGKLENITNNDNNQPPTLTVEVTSCSKSELEEKQENIKDEILLGKSSSEADTLKGQESLGTPLKNESERNENLNLVTDSTITPVKKEENSQDQTQIDCEHYKPAIEAFKHNKREIAKKLIEYLISKKNINEEGVFEGFNPQNKKEIARELSFLILILRNEGFLLGFTQVELREKFECFGVDLKRTLFSNVNSQLNEEKFTKKYEVSFENVCQFLLQFDGIEKKDLKIYNKMRKATN